MRQGSLQSQLLSNLSDISKRMAVRMKKDRVKKNGKTGDLFGGSSKSMSLDEDSHIRCAIPLVDCIRKGDSLPISVSGQGVKMCCTNDKCLYARQFVHKECFEQLENTLIKVISNLGSARGWTDIQRRNNLWEKKGLTLVQKNLRCHCGLGLMVRDADFYKKVELDSSATTISPADPKNNKKKKKKELPKLNFGYNNAAPPVDNAEMYKKKFNDLDSHFLSSHKDDSYEDFDNCDSSIASMESSFNGKRSCVPHDSSTYETPKRGKATSIQSSRSAPWKTVREHVLNGENSGNGQNGQSVTPPASVWKTIPSAAPEPILAQRKNARMESPQLIQDLNGRNQPQSNGSTTPSSFEISPPLNNGQERLEASNLPPSLWKNNLGQVNPMNGSKASLPVSSNNNMLGRKQYAGHLMYTLFGNSANFLLGERIMADLYLPKNRFC